jgi:hypothetical protein
MSTKLDATPLLGEAAGRPRPPDLPVAALIDDEDTTESGLDVALRLYAEKRERYFKAIERQMEKAMSRPRTFGNPRNSPLARL